MHVSTKKLLIIECLDGCSSISCDLLTNLVKHTLMLNEYSVVSVYNMYSIHYSMKSTIIKCSCTKKEAATRKLVCRCASGRNKAAYVWMLLNFKVTQPSCKRSVNDLMNQLESIKSI